MPRYIFTTRVDPVSGPPPFIPFGSEKWWTCRALPPGPSGNLLFVYARSLFQNYALLAIEQDKETRRAARLNFRIHPAAG